MKRMLTNTAAFKYQGDMNTLFNAWTAAKNLVAAARGYNPENPSTTPKTIQKFQDTMQAAMQIDITRDNMPGLWRVAACRINMNSYIKEEKWEDAAKSISADAMVCEGAHLSNT